MNPKHLSSLALRLGLTLAALTLLPASATAQLRPMNYDTPTFIEVELQELRAGDGAAKVTINVIRSGEFRLYTRVGFETADGSALAGDDYKASGGTLVFKPGEGYKSFEIELLPSEAGKEERRFEVRLAAESPNTEVIDEVVSIVIPKSSALPTLQITAAEDGAVKLSWVSVENVVLERTKIPGLAAWEAAPCAVQQTENGVSEALEQCQGQSYFYRLRSE